MNRPIVVVGPTGSGKSDLALDLAEYFAGEIVNTDAMQQYRGMDIGTAKMPVTDRRGIPHHHFDTLEVTDTANVAHYQRSATKTVEEILARNVTPVLVGGSMLYVQSLIDQWSFPATDPNVRTKWEQVLEREGPGGLHMRLAQLDPEAAQTILPTDPRRTVRALEVIEVTGKPFAASKPVIGEPQWESLQIGLRCELSWLDERIDQRTQQMFRNGFVDEVLALLPLGLDRGTTASRAIGYSHLLAALSSDAGLSAETVLQAQERTFFATRRYVRRQRSWFNRDHRVQWIDIDAGTSPESLLKQSISLVRNSSSQEKLSGPDE